MRPAYKVEARDGHPVCAATHKGVCLCRSRVTLRLRRTAESESFLGCLSQLDIIVQRYMAEFKGFFLNTMGKMFMRELYREFIIDRSGICLVALCGEDVVGVVVGTTQPKDFFRRLLQRRWPAFVIACLVPLCVNPLPVGRKPLAALSYWARFRRICQTQLC
jgi:hypothetical protein